ncbi:hypothetical protein [Alphaproteobacteria bacterium endosymbiont of Tiliacea citrago]|uniref:hypothetical protein n=1 Tax=Alphaproteobacteria bacterium endosymbiont of Tiliacea citrago TaxID=3077944 RepID=UPI00313DA29B
MFKFFLMLFLASLTARITKKEVITMHNDLIRDYNHISGNRRLPLLRENDERKINVINHAQMNSYYNGFERTLNRFLNNNDLENEQRIEIMINANQFIERFSNWSANLANLIRRSYHNRNIFRLGNFPSLINISADRPNNLNTALQNAAEISIIIDNMFNDNQERIINLINAIKQNIQSLIESQNIDELYDEFINNINIIFQIINSQKTLFNVFNLTSHNEN